jgi:hypothetical protein
MSLQRDCAHLNCWGGASRWCQLLTALALSGGCLTKWAAAGVLLLRPGYPLFSADGVRPAGKPREPVSMLPAQFAQWQTVPLETNNYFPARCACTQVPTDPMSLERAGASFQHSGCGSSTEIARTLHK